MAGAAAFSGQLLTSQVANAAPNRRRLVDALMPVAPQPVSKTLVGFAANGREADFSHLLGLGLPVQCARVYNPPGKRPVTLRAAHLQLVKDLNIPAVIVSYKPDCAEARTGAWDTWAAQCAMMMKQLTDSGVKVWVAFHHEMDNPHKFIAPADWIAMHNRLVPIMRRANPALKFAWIPMGFQVVRRGMAYPYVPDASTVDLTCPDCYSHGRSMKDVGDPAFAILDRLMPGKPHGLGETAIKASDCSNRPQWVVDGMQNAGLEVFVYYDENTNGAWALTDVERLALGRLLNPLVRAAR